MRHSQPFAAIHNSSFDGKQSLFVDFAKQCCTTRTELGLYELLTSGLKSFVSHETLYCAIGTLGKAASAYHINIRLDEDIAKLIRREITGSWHAKWLEKRAPIQIVIEDPPSEQSTTKLRGSGNSTKLVWHEVQGVGGKLVTYICFGGIAHGHENMVELVAPFIHTALVGIMLAQRRPIAESVGVRRLTKREHQVLGLVCKGKTNEQIGSILNISPWTVKIHMRNLMDKLDASSRAEAVAKALDPRVSECKCADN